MGRKVGSGERVVGSALVTSSLDAIGHQGRRKCSLGCWRCGWLVDERALDTLTFKGWAEEEQPPKDPGQEQAARDKEGRSADPGSSRSRGALPLEYTKQSGDYCTHRF